MYVFLLKFVWISPGANSPTSRNLSFLDICYICLWKSMGAHEHVNIVGVWLVSGFGIISLFVNTCILQKVKYGVTRYQRSTRRSTPHLSAWHFEAVPYKLIIYLWNHYPHRDFSLEIFITNVNGNVTYYNIKIDSILIIWGCIYEHIPNNWYCKLYLIFWNNSFLENE